MQYGFKFWEIVIYGIVITEIVQINGKIIELPVYKFERYDRIMTAVIVFYTFFNFIEIKKKKADKP